jgi:hypothetical protein
LPKRSGDPPAERVLVADDPALELAQALLGLLTFVGLLDQLALNLH